jgi:7,8-dihydropterin-6-yl-methyl-4-(beta-D-ribofuranosyl)aminobenzene 5'-phosphate synthase
MALWIATEDGLVVCVGCCHAGIINTIDHILGLSGIGRIRALIGGLHLVNAGPQRLAKTVEALAALPIDKVVACHCTGEAAFEGLATALGDRFVRGEAGGAYRF